jgi:hypothetical protein
VSTENNDPGVVGEDPVEVLEPGAPHRVQKFNDPEGNWEFEFTQKPLSFMGKLDFFSVLGKALDRALSGPDGVSVADLLDVPERADGGGISTQDIKDANAFIKGISKLLAYAPEIIGDLYCVLLNVPRGQRAVVKEVMNLHEDEGGLSDQDGVEILETFVEQNWEVLRDFFTQRIAGLAAKVGKKVAPESPSSKPSKATRQSTRKQSTS